MEEFAVGNVVQTANGPKMTVEYVGVTQINCVWFDEAGHLQRDTFVPAVLTKVQD